MQLQGIFHLPEEQRVKAATHCSLSTAGELRGLGDGEEWEDESEERVALLQHCRRHSKSTTHCISRKERQGEEHLACYNIHFDVM